MVSRALATIYELQAHNLMQSHTVDIPQELKVFHSTLGGLSFIEIVIVAAMSRMHCVNFALRVEAQEVPL